MNTKKTKILNYINVFRGLAILLIVMGHSMQFGEQGSLIHQINVELICGGTALFIFISGFLFQHLSYKYEFKNYMEKKWQNVILPYLFTAIPGVILCFTMPKIYGNAFDGLLYSVQIPMMLTVGRVHNTPAWFIPMIVIFFILSFLILYLEKKNILYKLLLPLFVVTVIFNRHDVDYSTVLNLSYTDKYFAYLNYVLMGFVHFLSMYVFGMYCSKNKDIINKFYDKRALFWLLMIVTACLNVYNALNFNYNNGTISKIFMTILLLCYLKHYDNWLLAHTKLNNILDFLAKYSFGLFFVHWYVLFLFNQLTGLEGVLPYEGAATIVVAGVRFILVTLFSLLILFLLKKALLRIDKEIQTRSFIGV